MTEHYRAAAKRRQLNDELTSLLRLIMFARQSAESIQADFPVYCLDLALGAVLKEIKAAELESAQLNLTKPASITRFH